MLGLCLTFGTAGWLGLGGLFAILGLTAPAVTAWGARTRPAVLAGGAGDASLAPESAAT
jgi:hypothetical protein